MELDPKVIREKGLIFNGWHLPYDPKLKERAKYFRENLTQVEKSFWLNFCKNNKNRWRTQVVIDHYIVDFYCPKLKLVIELDGLEHSKNYNREYDVVRDEVLIKYGLKIIRIDNSEIKNDFENISLRIQEIILQRQKHLNNSTSR